MTIPFNNPRPKKIKRTCRCGCGKQFTPKLPRQWYVNPKHRNRAGQQRLRDRAKKYYEMRSEIYGGIGTP